MAAHRVLRMGHPVLRAVAAPVERFDGAFARLVDDLWETMHASGGIGLAAPQIGVGLRVMIFGVTANPRYPDAEPVPETVLINPEYEVLEQDTEAGWEGCLSVPGMRGYVERPAGIRYRGRNQYGEPVEREASGFHAIVFQHEYDHLDGILYPDRLEDTTRFGFVDELAAAGVI